MTAPSPDPDDVPSYFGVLAPDDREVTWHGHTNTVTLRVLELGEELNCTRYARQLVDNQISSEDYLLAQTIDRMARAIVAVDGQQVDEHYKTLDERRAWVARFPGALIDAVSAAYVNVRQSPLEFLADRLADAKKDDGPSTDAGSSSDTPGPSS